MIIKVTGALLRLEDKYLICKRDSKGSMPGLWEFPGGKLEVGESLEDCIKRELKEELDIDAKIGKLFTSYIYSYSHITYHLFFYDILSFEGVIKMNVHKKIIWETVDRFKYYDFLPGDIPLIKILLN
jgi:8-oxo-dGTP diphosphatase